MDPDINSSEALNFAATEPITAVDKNGKQVEGTEVFKDFFSVDHATGQVTVRKPLQRDIAAVVRITVLVTDITAPTMQQGKGEFLLVVVLRISAEIDRDPIEDLHHLSIERSD